MTNEEAIRLVDDRMCYGRGKWSRHHQPVIDEYWQAGEMAIEALEKPEPHWIPVTEKLPETDKWRTTYIVTKDTGTVTVMEWENTVVRGKSVSRWIWQNRLSPWGVTAWMPLPEPYRGEDK